MKSNFMLKSMGSKTNGATERFKANIETNSTINSHCNSEPYPDFCLNENCWRQANWIQICPASLESNKLLPYTEECLNRWSEHVPPKLKSEITEDNSNYYFVEDNECVYLVRAS